MKHRITYLTVLLLLITMAAPVQGQGWKESREFERIFAEAGVQGTFVLYNVSDDVFIGYNKERSETRFVPGSTFKIFNALIGLSVGSVKNVDEILPWGGQPQPVKAWEKDMNLREAIKISNIPIYQEMARRTGLENMQAKIAEISYGNGELGEAVDRFWLDGPLKISAVEQVHLLAQLAQNKLPFSPEIQAAVRDIVKLEEGNEWVLYGKTGTAATYKPQIGWWVGWIDKSNRIYAFVMNMDMVTQEDFTRRIDLGKACLKVLDLP